VHPTGFVVGAFVALLVYWETFETIVFPRRVTRRFRFTRAFYRSTWIPWRALGSFLGHAKRRESFLSIYGPISLLLLLFTWVTLLMFAFALLYWAAGSKVQSPAMLRGFAADLLLSGATLFTLVMGDIGPVSTLGRVLAIVEGGTGLAFLAMVIGYLPVLSQAFSRREVNVALLDARAGSPPSAGELLVRHVDLGSGSALAQLLQSWDRWAADLLETHISYPVLAYYRSQHDNQSWVASLTTVLDVCALVVVVIDGGPVGPARMAFAMARHAAVDLSGTFRLKPRPPEVDRLGPAELLRLRQALRGAGIALRDEQAIEERLCRLRGMYEPYMNALAEFFAMRLPRWVSAEGAQDNWQSTA
jgi:hypothetical protein